jgi:saccharopine dehydrogenase-like NADP-dependent oxidoreductase
MSGRTDWMIYGANGYTGHLVAVETRRRGLNPVLAGRRAGPIEKLAAELDLPMRVFGLDDAPAAAGAIADMRVVANCAGPFAVTSAPMIDACLGSRAHYCASVSHITRWLWDSSCLLRLLVHSAINALSAAFGRGPLEGIQPLPLSHNP